jgi:uncharacterized protein YjbI with pentapeptide repeats
MGCMVLEDPARTYKLNPEHLEVARQGSEAIARWRSNNKGRLRLHGARMRGFSLERGDLSGAEMGWADLDEAQARWADFSHADMPSSSLGGCGADFSHATFRSTSLVGARLIGRFECADFRDAVLTGVTFGMYAPGALLHGAAFGSCVILDDLTACEGLEQVRHHSESQISHDALLRPTARPWPAAFLRGCGLSNSEIDGIQAMANRPAEFYSCFISYSSKDSRFAEILHSALQVRGIRCWLDKHEILPGDNVTKKIRDGIDRWDKVLLCCSRNSLTPSTGWWVTDEIERALQKERQLQKERNEETLAVIPLDIDGFLFDAACTHEHQPTLAKRHAAKFVGWQCDDRLFASQVERVAMALRADADARPAPPKRRL